MNSETRQDQATDLVPVEAPSHGFAASLSSTPRGARLARLLAGHQLDAWGWPYDTETSRDVSLLVGELAANAVLHGAPHGRDFQLRLSQVRETATLRIEVTDTLPDRHPRRAEGAGQATSADESGRGVLLIEALASRWGTTVNGADGKTVWCELDVPATTPLGN